MDSAFTLSVDWLAFTILASRPQETMQVLGGDWSKAKGGFRGYPLSWIRSDGLHGVGKLGTNAPRRPNEIHVDLSGGLVSALTLEKIAVLRKAEVKNFRFHDLRHTFATRLVQAGVDIYTAQKLGRWKTISMVMRYAHHHPESLRGGVEILDRVPTGVSTNLGQSASLRIADVGTETAVSG